MAPRLCIVCFVIGAWTSAFSQTRFPIVDGATQKLRDEDRREILDTELRSERELLEAARADFNGHASEERAADIRRHTENINSLLREVARVDQAWAVTGAARRPVIQAKHSASRPLSRPKNRQPSFWNPYNRALESSLPSVVSTALGEEMP